MASRPLAPNGPPQGYRFHPVADSELKVLVPDALPTTAELRRQHLQLQREKRAERRRERERRRALAPVKPREPDESNPIGLARAGEDAATDTKSNGVLGPPNPFELKALFNGDIVMATERWPRLADLGYDPRREHPVFDGQQVLASFERLASSATTRAAKERVFSNYRKLKERGVLRRIAVPAEGALSSLERSHPHFGETIAFVRESLELARRARRPLRIPPILLLGGAGVGKSHFAQALANALDAPVHRQPMDGGVTASAFVGSDKHWADSSPGFLYHQVCLGEAANPVVVLDELDKAGRPDYQGPLGPLHTLLEPVTAKQVRDLALDLEFDASLVTWIATANKVAPIPTTLLSRFKVFTISTPDAAQALLVAESVIEATVADMGIDGLQSPVRLLRARVAHLPAREIRKVTEEAVARASANGRYAVLLTDLPAWLLAEDGLRSAGQLH